MVKTKHPGNFWRALGPGLITGASDDDPSGILTYLQGGAVLGFGALWTALVTLPMMYAVQEMAGRIGLVTQKGLLRIIKENYSRKILFLIAFISIVVITINIGADLLAIGVAVQGLAPVSNLILLPLAATIILLAVIFFSYQRFAGILKWLTLTLFFYVLAVIYLKIDWSVALKATLIPRVSFSLENAFLLAAIFGTTVSPYLFFWQANEEIEEKEEKRRDKPIRRLLITKNELKNLKEDTFIGMLFSNVVTWFIFAGATKLFQTTNSTAGLATFQQASLVLKPLLGDFAYLAFTLGIIGTGFLAIPVLAGNIGYMFAEIFDWPEGINKKFHEARGFYIAIVSATILGMFINFFRFDPITLLIYTAVLYTFITPPIIYIILKISNNNELMRGRINSAASNILGAITLAISLLLAVFYLILAFRK